MNHARRLTLESKKNMTSENVRNKGPLRFANHFDAWCVTWWLCIYSVDEPGSKHKQMLNGRRSSHSQCRAKMTSTPRSGGRVKQRLGCKGRAAVGVSNQPFHCEMCQVSVNSETQLKQVLTYIQRVLLTLLQTSAAAHTASICLAVLAELNHCFPPPSAFSTWTAGDTKSVWLGSLLKSSSPPIISCSPAPS